MQYIDIVNTDQGTAVLDQVNVRRNPKARGQYRVTFRLTQSAPERKADGDSDDAEVLPRSIAYMQEAYDEGRTGGYSLRGCPIGIGELVDIALQEGGEQLLRQTRAEVRQVKVHGLETRARLEWLVAIECGAEVLGLISADGLGVLVTTHGIEVEDIDEAGDAEATAAPDGDIVDLDDLPPEPKPKATRKDKARRKAAADAAAEASA